MNKATAERLSDKLMYHGESYTTIQVSYQKERLDDAFAVADEFYEWLHPDHADDDDLIVYYDQNELEFLYY